MPLFNNIITDFVTGDTLEINRTIINVPLGQTLTKCWLTVKRRTTDTDNQAIIRKIITSINTPGTGHISNVGISGIATIRFDLTPADTMLLEPGVKYNYDIQSKTSTGSIYTPETGKMETKPGSTIDTS